MPLPHTVIDLWRMVYEHNCATVVMLNPWDETEEVFLIVHERANLIFIVRQHTDARYWYSKSVCLSVTFWCQMKTA